MDKYLVIGDPIEHSLSPFIHKKFAQDTQQNMQYNRQKVSVTDFKEQVSYLIKSGVKGMNITLPLKQLAFDYANVLSERAKLAGAVNTFKIENNQIFGDNTDGAGLIKDLTINLKITLVNKRILLLGAGGAARGIIKPLLDQTPSLMVIANRTPSRAKVLADEFSDYGIIESSNFKDIAGRFDLVLNATSASIDGVAPTIAPSVVDKNSVCYDLMYAKQATPFMRWAQSNNVKAVSDGLGMLIEQAAESFFIWRDVRPSTENLLRELRL